MDVTIKYKDHQSFTIQEIVAQAKRNYGKGTIVNIMPDSSKPEDLVEFAIFLWMTEDQVSFWHEDKHTYADKMKQRKAELMQAYSEAIDSVIKDNETKLTED